MPKFVRRSWDRFLRLGKKSKKKRVWRRPKGRHSKTREKMKGYPASVEIGYGTKKETRGKIREKTPVVVYNLKELGRIKKDEIAIIGKMGKKKKIEIVKIAKEKNIPLLNVNTKKLIRNHEHKLKSKEKKK